MIQRPKEHLCSELKSDGTPCQALRVTGTTKCWFHLRASGEHLENTLEDFSHTLNKKEKMILKDRLLSDTPKTLQEIANNFGISKERTRQLESRILKNLKTELQDFKDF